MATTELQGQQADGPGGRLGGRLMRAAAAARGMWRRFWRLVSLYMPKRLYARSLIIVIAPMFLLQSVIAFVFMERHWQTVTLRLSQAVVRDISAVIDLMETYPHDADYANVIRIAQDRLQLKVDLLPPDPLPAPGPKPFFSILDQTLSSEITRQINRPFWIDTVGNSNIVEVRIQLENKVLRVFVRRSQAYASNTHIFLIWMVGTSLVLLMIAIPFLRNQIRPILTLAEAAESFGKGRPIADFKPRGAREVRRAGAPAEQFHDMGTLAAIEQMQAPQPGLITLQCRGAARFRITHRSHLPHGLWVADVEQLPGDPHVPVPDDLQRTARVLAQVLASLRAREAGAGPHAVPTPEQLQDCGWVANRWCELLPLPADRKQRLMTLDNPLVRLELVGDMLERMGIFL